MMLFSPLYPLGHGMSRTGFAVAPPLGIGTGFHSQEEEVEACLPHKPQGRIGKMLYEPFEGKAHPKISLDNQAAQVVHTGGADGQVLIRKHDHLVALTRQLLQFLENVFGAPGPPPGQFCGYAGAKGAMTRAAPGGKKAGHRNAGARFTNSPIGRNIPGNQE